MGGSSFEKLPVEIIDLVCAQLCPSPQQRFNPLPEDPEPGTKAWLWRFGSWTDTCVALRLTCRSFSQSAFLKAALFYNINYLVTSQTLDRVEKISLQRNLAPYVKRVTFFPPPFKGTLDEDPWENLPFTTYKTYLQTEARGRLWQQSKHKDVLNPLKHIEIQAIEEQNPQYTSEQVKAGYEAFHQARRASRNLVKHHVDPSSGRHPIHHSFLRRLRNIEEVALSTCDWNVERNDCFRSKWASRDTFLHKAFPEILLHYLPPPSLFYSPFRPSHATAANIASNSSLRPKTLDLGTLSQTEHYQPIYQLASEFLEQVNELQIPNARVADLFLGQSALSHNLKKLSIGRRYDGYRPPEDYWTQWADVTITKALPSLQEFRVSCLKAVSGQFIPFLQSLARLQLLALYNFTLHDFQWKPLFETIRGMPELLVFDLDGLHPICPGSYVEETYPIHLTSERTVSDVELIDYIEGTMDWTENLARVWEDAPGAELVEGSD